MNLFDYLSARAAASSGSSLDMLIGRTQRFISVVTLIVIAGVLAALFALPKIDSTVEKLLLVVLGALMSNWATQNGFWYGRPRGAGVPDPPLTGIKKIETTRTTETTTAAGNPPPPTIGTGEPP
jgi:hypothetical protein